MTLPYSDYSSLWLWWPYFCFSGSSCKAVLTHAASSWRMRPLRPRGSRQVVSAFCSESGPIADRFGRSALCQQRSLVGSYSTISSDLGNALEFSHDLVADRQVPIGGDSAGSALAPPSVFRTLNLPPEDRQVLGADLNCSESGWGAADPLPCCHPYDSTHDAAAGAATAGFPSGLCLLRVICDRGW
jgi:hypothetical protein